MISVADFTPAALAVALQTAPRNRALVDRNPRVPYLASYLGTIGAQSMVIEDDYIDRNYLEDYAAYYVRCHADFGRKCRRIHFFSGQFTSETLFSTCLDQEADVDESLGKYLGFIVAKPLPQSFIGRTSVGTYPSTKKGGVREYFALASQEVHLLGRTFRIRSMPFQEQDSVVAACATTALWSALQTIGPLFGRYSPTPSEITAQTAGHPMKVGRDMPSSGLTFYQMMQSIIRHGFEPEARELDNQFRNLWGLSTTGYLAELVRAYGSAGLPVLLAHQLACDACKWTGFHAATIAGYSIRGSSAGITAPNIDEVYAHDDQAGPFSRMEFSEDGSVLSTEFPHHCESNGNAFAIPLHAVIPAYPKIRITYEEARSESQKIASWLAALKIELESETILQHAHEKYALLARNERLPRDGRVRILNTPPPRFLWSTTWYHQEDPVIELLLDATNVRPSFFCHGIVIHAKSVGEWLLSQFDHIGSTAQFIPSPYQDKWVAEIEKAARDWDVTAGQNR